MAPNHAKRTEDAIVELGRRIAAMQSALARGPVLPTYTSANLPANPPTGLEVLVTDYGLRAYYNGSAWIYPPQQINKQVLTAPASSVRLPASGSIPPVFTHLRLVVSAISSGTGANGYDSMGLQFNGVTAASYNWSTFWVTQGGASVQTTGGSGSTNMQAGEIWNSHFASAGRGIVTLEIPNYADSNNLKGFTSSSSASDGGAAGIQQVYSGALGGANTAPITSLTALMGLGTFLADSTFTLHGY